MTRAAATNPVDALVGFTGAYLEFEKPLQRIHQDIQQLEREQGESRGDLSAEIRSQRTRLRTRTKRLYSNLTPWETVLVARHPKRPLITDYIQTVVQDFCELHGDRTFGDDPAIMTGFGRIAGHRVMLVGHNKGKDTKERIACNFGCAHPEGYRKAMMRMKLAAKYNLPVVCLVDTQGAYPGIGSEERGISQAIAVNLMEMSRLQTPIVCAVIGEGGSGGALGIGVADRVAMFEHSFYSVISPEGCAAILFKTGEQRKRAAESLKLTSKELKKLGIIDTVIPEPLGGAHRNPAEASANLEQFLAESLRDLKRRKVPTLVKRRYERLRNAGSYFETCQGKKKIRVTRATSPSSGTNRSATANRVARLDRTATPAPRP